MELKDASYGRSTQGLDTLVKNVQNSLSHFTVSTMEVSFGKIKTAVRANWSGADAEAFIKKLDAFWAKYKEQVTTMSKKLPTFRSAQGRINI